MKKTFIFSLLIACAIVVQAQPHNTKVIITGVMADPRGSDANDGGYEYVQLLAVERINFEETPYSVIVCSNPGATNPTRYFPPLNGWVTGTADYSGSPLNAGMREKTYKFDLTEGIAEKGTYFYVGGAAKRIAGYWSSIQTTDISGANWIKAKDYSTEAGDGEIGIATAGLLANSGNPIGIAVFEGIAITEETVPVDAIFTGSAENMTSAARSSVHNATDYELGSTTYPAGTLGYRVPNNDIFVSTPSLPFLGMGSSNAPNRRIFVNQAPSAATGTPAEGLTTDRGNFLNLGGVYDDDTKEWVTPRLSDYRYITLAEATQTSFNLSDIETNSTKLASTLPVILTGFSAKTVNNQIQLNWTTASEKNNAYFEILRSVDGITFNKIGEEQGHGTTQTPQQYSFTDNSPVAGTNYYRLKQVDTDGKFSLSKVVAAGADLTKPIFTAGYANGSLEVLFNNTGSETLAEIVVSDIAGRKVASYGQNITSGLNSLSLRTSYLTHGVYVITLSSGKTVHKAKILVGN